MALIRREEPTLPPLDTHKKTQTHTILGPESVFEGKLTFGNFCVKTYWFIGQKVKIVFDMQAHFEKK